MVQSGRIASGNEYRPCSTRFAGATERRDDAGCGKIRADRSLRDLQRALTNISDERAAQRSAAQQLSLESASVPDGLTPGGLQIAIEAPELKGDAAACDHRLPIERLRLPRHTGG